VTGWDVLGASQGLYLVATRSIADVVRYYVEHTGDAMLTWNVHLVLLSLLPGALAAVWPWEYWLCVVTPCLFLASLGFLVRALRLPPAEWWRVLLPLGASPALLSHTVAGLPYISNTLPFALALWIVLRWSASAVATALLAVLTLATAWHVEELGRTVFVVFLAATFLLRDAPLRTRIVWLAAGVLQCVLAVRYPSSNTARYGQMTILVLPEMVRALGRLIAHMAAARHDLPLLVPAGLLALVLPGRRRGFWAALVLTQLALVWLLAANTGILEGVVVVWPRRALLLDFVCLAACATVLGRRGAGAAVVLALLLAGNVWQLAETARWASRPLDAGDWPGWSYTLPYTHTPLVAGDPRTVRNLDSRVCLLCVDWYREMNAALARGERLLLVYNFTSFDENATDPAGIIDRLYLRLGHRRFRRSVFVFGDGRVRVNELPIRSMAAFPAFVRRLRRFPREVRGYWLHNPRDDFAWPAAQQHRREVSAMFAALAEQLRLEWDASSSDRQGRSLHRFRLERR
jgi:hypothetical protein